VWTADIDVGGTLTDGLFTDGTRVVCAKVDSTPHDLTVCLVDCVTQGAAKLGFADAAAFLEQVELIRWSTTITSNVLAEGRGPRIGLLVGPGQEKNLYSRDGRSAALGRLVAEADVAAISDSADEAAILKATHALLERGVRRICISLPGAHREPEREARIKRFIGQQYPDHYLGSVPALAGSDVSKSADDATRTHCALINAYTHGALAATLFKAEDELRETLGFAGSFLVSQTSGGVAGVGKTRAIDTIESGPILGLHASAHLAQKYGARDVIAMDIGGTTAKLGLMCGGEPLERRPSDFFGIPVEISGPYLRSIALGGGSVVRTGGAAGGPGLRLGPESMGSYPGPACYGLGGDEATLTDAFVAAGLLNAEYFLGGAKRIDAELARKAIQERVAGPMGISVEEGCRRIVARAFEMVAGVIADAKAELGLNLAEHTLYAYGGNGGLFACGVAEQAGIGRVQMFSLGAVFSAFGSSVSDICHVYERAVADGAVTDSTANSIRLAMGEIRAEAVKDLRGEGIEPGELKWGIELEIVRANGRATPVRCAEEALASGGALRAALGAWTATGTASRAGETPALPEKMQVELLRVRVEKPMARPRLAQQPSAGADPTRAKTGTRKVLWGSRSGEAALYRWEALETGNRVAGCAILEGANTTYLVPEGWTMEIDGYGNGRVERK